MIACPATTRAATLPWWMIGWISLIRRSCLTRRRVWAPARQFLQSCCTVGSWRDGPVTARAPAGCQPASQGFSSNRANTTGAGEKGLWTSRCVQSQISLRSSSALMSRAIAAGDGLEAER